MSKGKENTGSAETGILAYLERQNRPYSAVDVFNNLHNDYGKTLVVKTLETLSQQGSVKEKVYGKQKVYVFNQENVPTADKAELVTMDVEIERLSKQNEQLQTEVNILAAKHKKLMSNMTLSEAKASLQQVNSQCQAMDEKLLKLRNGAVLISKGEKDKVYSARTKKVQIWKKRKRMATDILEAILEGYPKPKKTLYEDIGIETDEDCKVVPPKG